MNTFNSKFERLSVGAQIAIRWQNYTVKGAMYFEDSGYKWVEYELTSSSKKTVWLTFELSDSAKPVLYEKIFITNKQPTDEIVFENESFVKMESSKAYIVDCYGDVDVEYGDWVNYHEYSNISNDKFLSIEEWEDMTECSLGIAVNEIDIAVSAGFNPMNSFNTSNFNSTSLSNFRPTSMPNGFNAWNLIKTIAFVIFFVFIFGLSLVDELGLEVGSFFQNKSVEKFLKSDSNFVYTTSVTSETDNKEKANVYKTKMSLSDTAKYIITQVPGISYADESSDSDSLGMLNDKEYVFLYNAEDDEYNTYIQVSTRKYTYTSRNHLYRSRNSLSDLFYRDYYYNRGYGSDYSRYGSSTAFSDYSGRDFSTITNGKNDYNGLINSVRQSSVGSRSSSGGGTSFGK